MKSQKNKFGDLAAAKQNGKPLRGVKTQKPFLFLVVVFMCGGFVEVSVADSSVLTNGKPFTHSRSASTSGKNSLAARLRQFNDQYSKTAFLKNAF